MNPNSKAAVHFTAWSAIVGALFAYLNVTFSLMVTGADTAMILHGPTMLALPPDTRDLFRWSMVADIVGFYLPVLVIGGYLWHTFREKAGALGDMAVLAVAIYAVVGIAGASMQQAVLNPLAHLHAGGDESVKAAAEAAWTATTYGVQNGLWWSEGPVLLFWGLVVGSQLKAAGWGWFSPLVLRIVSGCFGLFFVLGFFPDFGELTELLETVVVLLFPLWMLLFGWQLLRRLASTTHALTA
jgi:hypothetical protein